jgi:hypothetical protein
MFHSAGVMYFWQVNLSNTALVCVQTAWQRMNTLRGCRNVAIRKKIPYSWWNLRDFTLIQLVLLSLQVVQTQTTTASASEDKW